MIDRITLHDFAVARDLSVELAPGFNVFTGETGAGKSLLVDALAFAFGGRRGREVIATGAPRATVEAVVAIARTVVTVERSVTAAGRASGRLDGAPATTDDLARLGADAIDIHGQNDQIGLLRPPVQRQLLDSFANTVEPRLALATQVRELRSVRRSLAVLTSGARERERRLEQLRFEVQEIDDAGLQPGEDDALRTEQSRIAEAGALIEAAAAAVEALDAPAIGELVAAVAEITTRDASAGVLQDLALAIESAATDLRRELRHYRDGIDEDPERGQVIGERLDLLARLRRKYGDTIEAILAYRASAAAELAELVSGGSSVEELVTREADLLPQIATAAAALSFARRNAARRLVEAVADELARLGMRDATLAVAFSADDDAAGPMVAVPDYDRIDRDWSPPPPGEPSPREVTESGLDRVEFLVSFNPGQDPRPLAAVASGGETSRFLLALSAVFAATAAPRTIVFDEVDEGVGGRTGSLVGEALRRLSERHQVLCITHLPQVAAFADRHFVVRKHADAGRTWSTIDVVEGEASVAELAEMMGGISPENVAAARSLRESTRLSHSASTGGADANQE